MSPLEALHHAQHEALARLEAAGLSGSLNECGCRKCRDERATLMVGSWALRRPAKDEERYDDAE